MQEDIVAVDFPVEEDLLVAVVLVADHALLVEDLLDLLEAIPHHNQGVIHRPEAIQPRIHPDLGVILLVEAIAILVLVHRELPIIHIM